MFKQRLITAMILAPLAFWGVLYANPTIFMFVAYAIYLYCAYEWLQLIPAQSRLMQAGVMLLFVLVPSLLLFVFYYSLWFGMLVWSVLAWAIVTYPASEQHWGTQAFVTVIGLVLLPLFLLSLIGIAGFKPLGRSLLMYCLLLVWAADIGAYFAGKYWGKHKLIPQVSPGKTREGLLGGLVSTMCVASFGWFYFHPGSWLKWGLMALYVFVMAVCGDLLISMLKRRVHLKDTGGLLPGHGGILDRLDSLIAVLPVFWLGAHWIFV